METMLVYRSTWRIRALAAVIAMNCMPALAPRAAQGFAVDPSEEARQFQTETGTALARFQQAAAEAWQYDNLRPAIARIRWPEGTIFKPPQAPVIHLSPGSQRYRELVGSLYLWGSLYEFRRARVTEVGKNSEAVQLLEKQLDWAKANYIKAYAWAAPYANLRGLVGAVPASGVLGNVFLPPPTLNLSPGSADYKQIVAELKSWPTVIDRCERQLEKLGAGVAKR